MNCYIIIKWYIFYFKCIEIAVIKFLNWRNNEIVKLIIWAIDFYTIWTGFTALWLKSDEYETQLQNSYKIFINYL